MIVSVQGAELFCSTRGEGPACLVLSGIGTKPYAGERTVDRRAGRPHLRPARRLALEPRDLQRPSCTWR